MASQANRNGEDIAAAPATAEGWRLRMIALHGKLTKRVVDVMLKLKKPGEEDPRRVIHPLKVGLAITLVSTTFYHIYPLYRGFGSSSIWAVFTVIVISEFSVGATLGKGLNRGLATFLAGALRPGSYYLANSAGDIESVSTVIFTIGEPILLGFLVFLLAAGVTYIRFFPQMKARYDYGLLVFILIFCLVSLSSYREEEILNIAHRRVTTILTGGLISVMVCIFVYPIWAGDDLHNLVSKNIEKLANFLQGFGDEYFRTPESAESNRLLLQGYISFLNSKQAEENLANFARWEPCHGRFRFHHPWQQYLKVGSLSRNCAYRIDALNGFLNSAKTPPQIRSKIEEPCINISIETGKALKDLAVAITKMIPPSAAELALPNPNPRLQPRTSNPCSEEGCGKAPISLRSYLLLLWLLCWLMWFLVQRGLQSLYKNYISSQAKFKNKDNKVAPELRLPPSPQHQEPSGPHHVVTIINQPSTDSSQTVNS